MTTRKIAAIDVGSNSIKLVLVEVAADSSFNIIWQERERVRLGQKTNYEKLLSSDEISRSAKAVSRFQEVAEAHGIKKIIAVATASVREAKNADDFVSEIEKETGIRIEVLSPTEEARLIGIAAAHYFNLKNETFLNIDIGGGSTELSLMRGYSPEKLFSMPTGAVGMTEKFLSSDPPTETGLENIRNEIISVLKFPANELKNENWQMVSGTSGTILNLATLLNFQTNEESEISIERLTGLNKMLHRISLEERSKLPGISPQRAEVIVAGGQILECVMKTLKIETLKPCGFALREGVIIDYLRNSEPISQTINN